MAPDMNPKFNLYAAGAYFVIGFVLENPWNVMLWGVSGFLIGIALIGKYLNK